MEIVLTWQSIITAGAVITAAGLIIRSVIKAVRWTDRQAAQDVELQHLHDHHEEDMEEIRKLQAEEMASINEELTLLTYGVLACLKGLQEKGCNGPVTEAINKIEKRLNLQAHKKKEV